MRRAGVKDTSGVLEVSLTEKIGLRVARSSLAMLAATCKAMQAAIRQIERHPFKRGDTLMLRQCYFRTPILANWHCLIRQLEQETLPGSFLRYPY